MAELKKAICVLRCQSYHQHGIVEMTEVKRGGAVKFRVYIHNIPPGLHGFHIHNRGNEVHGAESLCDHFNPSHKTHGNLNDTNSHIGDLGNLETYRSTIKSSEGNKIINMVNTEFIANRVRLRGSRSIIGRSLVVHDQEDDLGLGNFPDSLTTGHSGKRIMWGIIGVNDGGVCPEFPPIKELE